MTLQRLVAQIPTNSLMMIEEKIGDKLDDHFYVLRGALRTALPPKKDEIIPDCLWVFKNPSANKFYLSFDRRKNHNMKMSLGNLVDKLQKNEAYDLFLSQLTFHFHYQEEPVFIHMENIPPPPGSPMEAGMTRARKKFLKRHGYEVSPDTMRIRMLRFSIAETMRGHLDNSETSSPRFHRWLAKETCGLVGSIEEKALTRMIFRGGKYMFYDSVWKDDFQEFEEVIQAE